MDASVAERFWGKVDKSGECWVWTACTNSQGYGQIRVKTAPHTYKALLAHRLSFEDYSGVSASGSEVLHTCDTPRCVRPQHLSLGTHADNMRDMASKGRSRLRMTHCKRGHAWADGDWRLTANGARQCRACIRERYRSNLPGLK